MHVIGTAGHVDHGKSALVRALTGEDPDRWPEEKERGLTIDLGFAELSLPSGRIVSIVDVPGHERFIKNMLAGAGGINLALLVVAADEGVMPQTREHLAILDLLGVRRGVVALTRTDLATPDVVALATAEAEQLVATTSLAGSPVVPCSSVTGAGLGDLVSAIDSVLESVSAPRDIWRPRLPVDRAFTMTGFGTVVTGTLLDGSFAVGQTVEILPGGLSARIRGIQNHGRSVDRTLPGSRTALNLAGVAAGDLGRGMVVAMPGHYDPVRSLDVRLRTVTYLERAIKHNLNVTFHQGAAEAAARLVFLDADVLGPGETCWAQIRLATPAVVAVGDRYVVRDSNGTLGGGQIVRTDPPRHRRHHAATVAALEVAGRGTPEERLIAYVAEHQPVALTALEGLGPGGGADDHVQSLVSSGLLVAVGKEPGTLVFTSDGFDSVRSRALEMIASYQEAHPLRRGIPRRELGQRIGLEQARLDPLLAHLAAQGDVKDGERVATRDFTPALDPAEERVARDFIAALKTSAHAPPSGMILDPEVLAYLCDSGAVVDTGDNVVFDAESYREMAEAVTGYIEANGPVTLAQVRDMLGTTRKYAQSLLETMDQQHLTRRVGDARVLYRTPS
jgi:selenocysteine-specific elongation factor